MNLRNESCLTNSSGSVFPFKTYWIAWTCDFNAHIKRKVNNLTNSIYGLCLWSIVQVVWREVLSRHNDEFLPLSPLWQVPCSTIEFSWLHRILGPPSDTLRFTCCPALVSIFVRLHREGSIVMSWLRRSFHRDVPFAKFIQRKIRPRLLATTKSYTAESPSICVPSTMPKQVTSIPNCNAFHKTSFFFDGSFIF